jgi:glycosyltransferase involved in cell wall biosynthesis
VRLILLGEVEGTAYVWFKDLLDSLPSASRIEMRGLVDSDILRDYYRSCDLFLMPTYHEGSPRVVKEAMACGLPVVTSRVSGNYAIDPQGKSLVYASDWDPSEYAGLMDKVLGDSRFRERRIEEGLKLADLLRPEAVARNYLELYYSLF